MAQSMLNVELAGGAERLKQTLMNRATEFIEAAQVLASGVSVSGFQLWPYRRSINQPGVAASDSHE